MDKFNGKEKDRKIEKVNMNKEINKKARAEKPIIMWAIIDNEHPDTPITFTSSRRDALLALDQYLFLKHYKHFRLWCPLHGYSSPDHGKAWMEYSKALVNSGTEEDPLYTMARIEYEPNALASIIRQHYNCTPLGCPFDTDDELDAYSNYLAEKSERVLKGEDTFSPIEEALDILFDDLEGPLPVEDHATEDESSPSGYEA